jgi:hypothetical protein
MVADALLSNPALFGGHLSTPKQCIRDWVGLFYWLFIFQVDYFSWKLKQTKEYHLNHFISI